MDEYESLSHSKWECKYHVVFIPKCRRRTLYGELRPHLGEVFRKLALQKESRVEEGCRCGCGADLRATQRELISYAP
jgi:putative transposase